MAQGPTIHKRVVGGPPSDLPERPLEYPGKPLSRRFDPLEQTRKFEETKSESPDKVARTAPFKPVSSINFPDKDIHIAPVSNMRPRGLQPVALGGTLLLPVGGSGLYDLSDDIRRPLEARLDRVTGLPKKAPPEISPKPENKLYPKPKTPETGKSTSAEALHSELENVKKLAREEISKREGETQVPETPNAAAPVQPTPQPTVIAEPSQNPIVETPLQEPQAEPTKTVTPITHVPIPTTEPVQIPQGIEPPQTIKQPETPPQPTTKPEEETRRLLTEAEKLEKQLSHLREGITASVQQSQEKVQEPPTPPIPDPHVSQIEQLVTEKTQLETKVSELSNTYNEELQRRRGVERQLETAAKDFDRKLQHIQIEKTNLLGRLKKIEEQGSEIAQGKIKEEQLIQEVSGLKSQLASVEKERDESNSRLQKLESLVKEIGSKEQQEKARKSNGRKRHEGRGGSDKSD
jgi:hypothetical protein